VQIHQIPSLRNPIAICAFNGWNDAGEAASGVLSHLINVLTADSETSEELIAEFNSEDFYDYQQVRPMIYVDQSLVRRINWPNTFVYALKAPNFERDFIIIKGPEPSFKWQSFANQLLDLCEDLEADLLITVGALLADTPHTRPISVTGSSANPNLAKRFGYQVSRYEGPTGILGVIQNFAQNRDLDAISLWASLPHYASGAPSPKATLALIEELSDFLEMELPLGDLEDAAKAWEIAVTQLAEEDSEINEYVKQLEADKDDADFEETTGDALAKEFERYLKRQKDT
jgi:proteasome assembly chaperone (PAC2) family protein